MFYQFLQFGPCFQVAAGPRGPTMTNHFAMRLSDGMKFIHDIHDGCLLMFCMVVVCSRFAF